MPFDFKNMRKYSIDYEKLFDEYNSKNLLSNKRLQEEYVYRWMELLKRADKKLLDSIKTKEDFINLSNALLKEPSIFQQPIHFKGNDILIHFRITEMNKYFTKEIKANYSTKEDVKEFLKRDREIYWTPIDENVDSYKDAKDPVIIAPFISGQYRWLLIDGNHRVTYAIKNKKDIRVLTVAQRFLVENRLFASDFDKLFYIMNNEFQYMYDQTIRKIPSEKIIKDSFIIDGELKIDKEAIEVKKNIY